MKFIAGFVLALSCTQVFALFEGDYSPKTIINYIPSLPADLKIYLNDFSISFQFNVFQTFFQKEIEGIVEQVNISDCLDDLDNCLQTATKNLIASLPSGYEEYGAFASATTAVTLGLTGNIKTICGVYNVIGLDVLQLVIKQYGMPAIDNILNKLNKHDIPRSSDYFNKDGMSTLASRLKDENSTNFVEDAVNQYNAVNNKYSPKITNLVAAAEYALFTKIFICYRTLHKDGVDNFLNEINGLNLGNGLKDTLDKTAQLLNDLTRLKVGGLVDVGQKVRDQISSYAGLPQNLLGYALNVALSAIKSILTTISSNELASVVSVTSKVNANDVFAHLEDRVNALVKKSKYKNEGSSTGMAMTFLDLTRFLVEPYKSNLKASIYIFLAVLQPVLEFVNTDTLVKLFGTSESNYLRLAIMDQKAKTYGSPTGS